MSKVFEQKLTRFDGGILDDIRESSDRGFQISTHFDIWTNPLRLTPYRSTEANETKTQNIVRFGYANEKLYGLGIVAEGNSRPAIYYKASNNITDAWTAPTDNAASSGGDRNTSVFFHYKNYFYGFSGTTILWRWGDLTGTPTFAETYQTLDAFTNVAQAVHHPADDCAYFFVDNKVHRLNDTVFDGGTTTPVLTLPSNLIITDAEPVGNYLVIACKPKNAGEKSVVFWWDRDSSLSTITAKATFEGDILYVANLDGKLIGIVDYYLNNSTLNLSRGKLIIKEIFFETARTIREIQQTADDTTRFIPNSGTVAAERTKIVKDNRLYFPVACSDQLETWRGMAVVDSEGRITMDYVEEEATSIQGAFLLGNYWFIAHSADGSINRSDDGSEGSAVYAFTSVYQSQKYNLADASKKKKLLAVTLMTSPLPSGASATLKYRKDESTTWTTIFTSDTDNSISHSAVNIESSGTTLPEFKEIQFRIESDGGAEIIGLKFKAEEVGKDIYS